jgi:hypothetical protein
MHSKMVHKRTTELSLVFVFVEMIFLVPVITEKALARIEATAYAPAFSELFFLRIWMMGSLSLDQPGRNTTVMDNDRYWNIWR